MALLGLGERLEPVGDLVEAFLAGGAGHARVHVGVLVGLAGDRRLQIGRGVADRQAGRRVADRLEELPVAVGVAGLALGARQEPRDDVAVALAAGLLASVESAAVGLRTPNSRRQW